MVTTRKGVSNARKVNATVMPLTVTEGFSFGSKNKQNQYSMNSFKLLFIAVLILFNKLMRGAFRVIEPDDIITRG